jgi:Ser/Thr protein kinase RdoA (MazF antagonist)
MAWDHVFYWPEKLVIFDSKHAASLTPKRMEIVGETERLVAEELRALSSSPVPPQLIHGDLHFWNVHIHRSNIWLFDFEDVMAGYPVQDVAITLFYGRDRDDYPALAESFRRGYETVAAWPARNDRQLHTLMAGRTLTFINYMLRAADDPEPYLKKAIARLERFLAAA